MVQPHLTRACRTSRRRCMPNVAPLHANDLRRVGRYRLTGRITGLPADGPVFLAAMANGGQVTLTLLDADWTQNGAARDRFTAEARVARRVAPFCTARILDAGLDEGQAYLVSEYVAGPSLAEFIADQGPCASSGLSALAAGTATGLTASHQAGLVHGQFGPDHVVLGVSGPRVVGFGITPPYGNATPAADMLAWANTVLFAAAGRSAADAGDLAKLAEPLRSLVARCAVPDAAGRPAAQTVLAELLGADDQAADLLAEGSRQAVRAGFRPPPGACGPGPPASGQTDRSDLVDCRDCGLRAGDRCRRPRAAESERTLGRRQVPGTGHRPAHAGRNLVGPGHAADRHLQRARQAGRGHHGRHHSLRGHLLYLRRAAQPDVRCRRRADDASGDHCRAAHLRERRGHTQARAVGRAAVQVHWRRRTDRSGQPDQALTAVSRPAPGPVRRAGHAVRQTGQGQPRASLTGLRPCRSARRPSPRPPGRSGRQRRCPSS